jgi:serine/threonine-protein kinase RsbW
MWKCDKTIPSELDAGHASIEELMNALESAGWEGRDVFHIQMAIEEAVVNAIEHGNKRDASKYVHIIYLVDAESAEMTITDQGDGFDHQNVADPTEEERLDQPRGRGVLLIRELMTQAQYNQKGNSVWMRKERSKDDSEAN